MKNILLLCALVVLTGACDSGATKRFSDFYTGDASTITRIAMLNGINGETHAIRDAKPIAAFFDLVTALSFTRQANQSPRGGYLYRVDLYQGEDPALQLTFNSRAVAIDGTYYDLDADVRARLDALYRDAPERITYHRLRFELTTTAQGARVTTQDTSYFLTARALNVAGNPLKWGVDLPSVWVAQVAPGNRIAVTADYAVTSRGRFVTPLSLRLEQTSEGASALRVWNVIGNETELIREIRHDGATPLDFALDLSMLDQRARLTGEIAMVEPRPMLWAYYYPWYVANEWDTAILRDRPRGGYYTSGDRAVLARHIEQAQSAGIDGFISSWWGPGSYTDENLARLLDLAREKNFAVMINFELLGNASQPRSESEIFQWLRYAISRYGKHPAYARVGGKPVFVIWASYQVSETTWAKLLARLKAEGLDALLLAEFAGTWAKLNALDVFGGMYQYNILNVVQRNDQVTARLPRVNERTRFAVHYFPLLADAPAPKIWAATVQPGYDDHLIPGRTTPILDRQDGALYRAAWDAALASNPDWIFITTWNEWWEHTYIEPSQNLGDLYLQITREYAQRWK